MASGKVEGKVDSPPSLSERQACHKARDDYFKCLDDSNERKEACESFVKAMEAVCRPTWVNIIASELHTCVPCTNVKHENIVNFFDI